VHRQHTPWFDARFRGYGRNKIMYAAALNSSGFSFVVDPDTFVVHRPHGISGAQTVFYEAPDRRRVPLLPHCRDDDSCGAGRPVTAFMLLAI
jgi:Glycosyl-transferase for dystroglycan